MPTPSKSRPQPRSLRAEEHERLARKLKHVRADLAALRTVVKATLGDGEAYESAQEALEAARRLALSLCEALPGVGADPATTQELRSLYLQAEAEPAQMGHRSSLLGGALDGVSVREGE